MKGKALVAAAMAVVGVGIAGPASAHVFIEETEAPAGGYALLTVEVPHGCEDSPTTEIAVQLPEGTLSVVPEAKPGWDAQVEVEELDEPIETEDGEVTEAPSVVRWTATDDGLPHDQLVRFAMSVQMPDGEAGETVFFPTVQTCAEGETAWIEQWDGEGEEPEEPAPSVLLVEAEGHHSGGEEEEHAEEEATEGEETASAELTAAQDDADAARIVGIVGIVVGLAGLVVAIVALRAARGSKAGSG